MEDEVADRKFMCTEHNKPIEAFCRSHATDVCSYCIAVKHVVCDVDSWAKDINREMQNLSKQLFKATAVQEKLNSVLKNSSQNKETVHEELKTKVLHVLSLLEKRLLECLEKECNKQFSVAEKRNSKCSEDASDAEVQLQCLNDLRHTSYADIKNGIEQAKETRRKLQLAVLEAEGCETLERIKTNVLDGLKKLSRNSINQFKETVFLSAENTNALSEMPISQEVFDSKPKDDAIRTETSFSSSLLSSFEVISLTESSLPWSDDVMTRSKNQPNALNLIAGFDAKRANDAMKCWLTGVSFLHDDRIVLADRNNSKLKLFSKDLKFLDSVPVDGKPFDVIQTDHETVAVSLPEQQKIKFFEVNEIFVVDTVLKEIDTKQPCYGLAHHDGNLYVVCLTTYTQQGCIKVYNANGDIIDHITQTEDGQDFIGSLKIAVSPETKHIYFRELSWTTWKVRFTTEKPEAASNVSGSKSIVFQGCPVGFAAAKDGAFVANIQTNSIQWLDCNSEKVFDLKHLRTEFFFPFALALNKDCSRLLATNSHLLLNCDDNSIVRVFDIVRDD